MYTQRTATCKKVNAIVAAPVAADVPVTTAIRRRGKRPPVSSPARALAS